VVVVLLLLDTWHLWMERSTLKTLALKRKAFGGPTFHLQAQRFSHLDRELLNGSREGCHKIMIKVFHINFMTTLSTSIKKFFIEVICKKKNRMVNPWCDKECKMAIKVIRDVSNESLKSDKINKYKALIKKKKRYYINRKQEFFLHLYKLDPKKFWRQILTRIILRMEIYLKM
jgi:hypothetical protein